MIGICPIEELEAAADMALWFFSKTHPKLPFRKEEFVKIWSKLDSAGTAFILYRRAEDSIAEAIGVILHPDYSGDLVASTAFWYLNGDPKGLEGGQLYHSLIAHLQSRNVKRFYFSALLNERYGKVTGFLVKSGFVPVEIHYMKDL